MILPEFEYLSPNTLDTACALAAELGDEARMIAGGTDVIVAMKEKKLSPKYIIDLKEIGGLNYIVRDEKSFRVGGLTKLRDIEKSELLQSELPAVADAAHYVASTQVRAKGTMTGNIVNASPSADTAPILLALNAGIVIQGVQRNWTCPMSDFYTGFRKTALVPGDIITEIELPELKENQCAAYCKLAVRKAMDLAIVGVAAVLTVDNGICTDARIALGAVAPTTMRSEAAEKVLMGSRLTDVDIENAGIAAMNSCAPISDVRASAEYRSDMVRVFTKRAIRKALDSRRTELSRTGAAKL